MKKKVIAGIIGIAAIVAITVGIVIVNQKPELATSSVTIEAGEEFKPEAKDFFKGKHSGDVKIDTSKVDTDKVGEYEATATYKKHNYTITVKDSPNHHSEVRGSSLHKGCYGSQC